MAIAMAYTHARHGYLRDIYGVVVIRFSLPKKHVV